MLNSVMTDLLYLASDRMRFKLRYIRYGFVLIILLVGMSCTFNRSVSNSPIELPSPTPMVDNSATETPALIDFNLKGVRLGDPESEVLVKLGAPTKRINKLADLCGISKLLILKYEGAEIHLDPDSKGRYSVLEIHVSSPSVLMSPDFRTGEKTESIVAKFGKPYVEKRDRGETLYYYYLTKNNDNAQLVFFMDTLTTARFYINPC